MNIKNSESGDIEQILVLYAKAIEFQKSKKSNHWYFFDQELLEVEINEHRHWKIIENEEMACVFSVTFHDELIWGERDKNPSIYLHRIVTDPEYMGRGYVRHIVDWARIYSIANGIQFIRLDTFGGNDKLNQYYEECGFVFCGFREFSSNENAPPHYLDGPLSLFEIKVEN
jgi:GNAT superfamily N-acetyltransferase